MRQVQRKLCNVPGWKNVLDQLVPEASDLDCELFKILDNLSFTIIKLSLIIPNSWGITMPKSGFSNSGG